MVTHAPNVRLHIDGQILRSLAVADESVARAGGGVIGRGVFGATSVFDQKAVDNAER